MEDLIWIDKRARDLLVAVDRELAASEYIAEDLWTLDRDGSVLCPECAAEHVGYWIEHFRPDPRAAFRPHTEDSPDLDLTCDECSISVREWVSGLYPDDDDP